ncbi:hypothetical protein ES703_70353 [subsurface metagenome]
MCRFEVRLDEFHIAFDERHDMVRPPAIALGIASSIDPGLDRRALFGEADVVVAVIGRIGIKIDIVIVQAPRNIVLGADLCDLLHVLNCAELRLRWVNVRQTVVVTPSLPDVHGQQRIGQAVSYHSLHRLSDFGITATPDIKNKSTCLAFYSSGCLFVEQGTILSGTIESPLDTRHERHRRIEVRVKRIYPLVGIYFQIVRRIVRSGQERDAFVKVKSDVAC